MLNFFSGAQKLSLLPKVCNSPNTRNLFLRLLAWDDELLSTPKIVSFPAKLLPKFDEPEMSNVIPYPLYT